MDRFNEIFKIKHNNQRPAKGRILIAEPFLSGKHFARSVVLVVQYEANGVLGFVINKPSIFTLNALIPALEHFPVRLPIYIGGPVVPERLFFIHTLGPDIVPGCIEVADGLYFDGDLPTAMQYLFTQDDVNEQIRFFAGYAGWDVDQLADEIEHDTWLVSQMPAHQLMTTTADSCWKQAVETLGQRYAVWTKYPKDPDLN